MARKTVEGERIGPKKLSRPARRAPKRAPAKRRPASGARAAGRAGEEMSDYDPGILELDLVAIIVPGEHGEDSLSALVDSIDEGIDEFDIFDEAPEAVHIFTPEGLIRSCNPAFDELFGAPSEVYVGQHTTLLNPTSVERNYRLLEEILDETRKHGLWKGTMTHRRWDGTEFTTRATVYPLLADGERFFVCFQTKPAAAGGKTAAA